MPSPTRPSDPSFLDHPDFREPAVNQFWNHLFFLHWIERAERLRAILPSGLELDEHAGSAFVGIVGSLVDAVRPEGLPVMPWLSYFCELNVRIYVRDPRGTSGVYFLSLDCNRASAVWIGRSFFGLPYRHASMNFGATTEEFTLQCRRLGWNRDRADYAWQPVSLPKVSPPGTLEHHLFERYQYFTRHRGRLYEGSVSHAPCEVSQALFSNWSALPLAWNGLPIPDGPPDFAHYCRGVSVAVYPIRPFETSV
jgi:uncharacterized protein YqjF (DUF2071 family)